MLSQRIDELKAAEEQILAFMEERGASISAWGLIQAIKDQGYREEDIRSALWYILDPEIDGRLVMLKDRTIGIRE